MVPRQLGVGPWGEAADLCGRVTPPEPDSSPRRRSWRTYMALLTRARGLALAGVTSIAVVMPVRLPGPAARDPCPPSGCRERLDRGSRHRREAQVEVVPRLPSRSPSRARKVMRTGNSLKGTPYRYGGATPRGFDCSGFTMYVYRKAGVKLSHSATAQMHKARRITQEVGPPRRPGVLPQRQPAPTTSGSTPGRIGSCTRRARQERARRQASGPSASPTAACSDRRTTAPSGRRRQLSA